jgi:SAM-dependent methyltransferase
MNKEIINYWDTCHTNNDKMWLAGSHLQEVLLSLDIKAVKVNGNTLVIGVGLGYEVQGLREFTTLVDVLDISEVALSRVRDITHAQYLASEIWKLPISRYDLVISHLVAQHMNDRDFKKQLELVIRSLKADGVYALQIAFDPQDKRTREEVQGIESQKTGYVFRSLGKINDMVTAFGGFISSATEPRIFEHTTIQHQFIQIRRL